MSEMMKLAERVEGLEGPCRATDAEIAYITRWRWDGWEEGDVRIEDRPLEYVIDRVDNGHNSIWQHLPRYTASLDAAMRLVPATCLFWCRELWDDQRKAGYAGINIYRDMTHVGETTAVAATPALALVSAALKARAHLEGE